MYHFRRNAIPKDIKAGKPNSAKWGKPNLVNQLRRLAEGLRLGKPDNFVHPDGCNPRMFKDLMLVVRRSLSRRLCEADLRLIDFD